MYNFPPSQSIDNLELLEVPPPTESNILQEVLLQKVLALINECDSRNKTNRLQTFKTKVSEFKLQELEFVYLILKENSESESATTFVNELENVVAEMDRLCLKYRLLKTPVKKSKKCPSCALL